MRIQLALNVTDLDTAVSYYRELFGVEPHKRRAGYANFAVDEPPLKLVLFENPGADSPLNHLGIEVFSQAKLDQATHRLTRAGIAERSEHETTCCHATQNKVWSTAPDGLRWEWYRIIDDDPDSSVIEKTPTLSRCC